MFWLAPSQCFPCSHSQHLSECVANGQRSTGGIIIRMKYSILILSIIILYQILSWSNYSILGHLAINQETRLDGARPPISQACLLAESPAHTHSSSSGMVCEFLVTSCSGSRLRALPRWPVFSVAFFLWGPLCLRDGKVLGQKEAFLGLCKKQSPFTGPTWCLAEKCLDCSHIITLEATVNIINPRKGTCMTHMPYALWGPVWPILLVKEK